MPCLSVRIHSTKITHEAEGVWCLVSGPYETGGRVRAPMDGFTACPEIRHCTTLAPMLIAICCAKLTHAAPRQLLLRRLKRLLLVLYLLHPCSRAHPCARGDRETLCKIDTIASHIHVLYRDIPFVLNIILNITTCPEGRYHAPSAPSDKNQSEFNDDKCHPLANDHC